MILLPRCRHPSAPRVFPTSLRKVRAGLPQSGCREASIQPQQSAPECSSIPTRLSSPLRYIWLMRIQLSLRPTASPVWCIYRDLLFCRRNKARSPAQLDFGCLAFLPARDSAREIVVKSRRQSVPIHHHLLIGQMSSVPCACAPQYDAISTKAFVQLKMLSPSTRHGQEGTTVEEGFADR